MTSLVIGSILPSLPMTRDEKEWGITHRELDWLKNIVRRDETNIKKALQHGESMLHVLARDDAEEGCGAYIASGANVDAIDSFGQTPLFTAIQNGNIEICQLLLDANANPNHGDNNANTPLMAAITTRLDIKYEINIQLIDLLLKSGAKINQVNRFQETPLKVACIAECTKVARHLIDNGGVLTNE